MNAILERKDFSHHIMTTMIDPSPAVKKLEILLLGKDAPVPVGAVHLGDYSAQFTNGWLYLYLVVELAVVVDEVVDAAPAALLSAAPLGVPHGLQTGRC